MSSSLGFPGLAVAARAAATAAHAKPLVTLKEALASALGGCAVRTETLYLTPEQSRQVMERGGTKLASDVVIRHVADCEKKNPASGRVAYTDTHRVRTHPETLLIVVDSASRVAGIEVLSFDEPMDYLPRGEWYAKFTGHGLGPELAIKKAIPPVTGASLTTRSTTEASRRVL
ncbi:MAG TPA: hypothetical protein VM598_13415, partial [Bdellovibrionota bacterium]|nr:hypothetical protein [Bdellovibrionota bacterium]